MAIAPNRWGASLAARKIAVGPSAPPIMPMAPASAGVKPRYSAPIKVRKMPVCAAAPSSTNRGLESMVEKSVIAPMPRKISGGKIPWLTPK